MEILGLANLGFWPSSFITMYLMSIMIVFFYIIGGKQAYKLLLFPILLGPIGLLIYYFKYR